MRNKFGVLITFNDGLQELHGLYDNIDLAKGAISGFLKVIEKNYKDNCDITKYNTECNDYYFYEGEYTKEQNQFPTILKIIKVVSGRFL